MADDIQILETSVLNLIKRYVKRQQIAFNAFRALRPAIIEADNISQNDKKLTEVLSQYVDEPWMGQWQDWTFYFQGIGCRLIHEETAEIIEWEAPDIHTFDRHWFVNWLEWLWIYRSDDPDLAFFEDYFAGSPTRNQICQVIFPVLSVMVEDNFIRNDPHHKNTYRLDVDRQSMSLA